MGREERWTPAVNESRGFFVSALFMIFFVRNAYIRRNTLSPLRLALVVYVLVNSLRQIRRLRVLLVSSRFND